MEYDKGKLIVEQVVREVCAAWSLTHGTTDHNGPIKPKILKGHPADVDESTDQDEENLKVTPCASVCTGPRVQEPPAHYGILTVWPVGNHDT